MPDFKELRKLCMLKDLREVTALVEEKKFEEANLLILRMAKVVINSIYQDRPEDLHRFMSAFEADILNSIHDISQINISPEDLADEIMQIVGS